MGVSRMALMSDNGPWVLAFALKYETLNCLVLLFSNTARIVLLLLSGNAKKILTEISISHRVRQWMRRCKMQMRDEQNGTFFTALKLTVYSGGLQFQTYCCHYVDFCFKSNVSTELQCSWRGLGTDAGNTPTTPTTKWSSALHTYS